MASDISSGGSSEFLAARKYFRANSNVSKEEVEVFVEDKLDSVFWRHYLSKYEGNKLFRIKVLRCEDRQLCGKDALIEYVKLDSLGRSKLIAIDSDYDYIIDNYHAYTEQLRSCKYALHTQDAYSIENYKILPSILKDSIYLTSLCELVQENIDGMLMQASMVYYPLFIIHLFSVNKKDKKYTMSAFKSDLHHLTYNACVVSDRTAEYVKNRIVDFAQYIEDNQQEYHDFLKQLNSTPLKDTNCWQFINGHDVFEEFGVKIVYGITSKYRGEYLRWLHTHINDSERKENLLKYFNNTTGVKDTIHDLHGRIREILYDSKPNLEWEPSRKIDQQLNDIYM